MGEQKINALTRKLFLQISPPGNGDIIGDQERILNALTREYGAVRFSRCARHGRNLTGESPEHG